MLATQIEVSDGTLSIINVGIKFFEQDDISVSLDQSDLPLVLGVDYVWSAATTVTFLASPNIPGGLVPAGTEVIIRRDTKNDAMYNILDGGAPFSRLTLDENYKQLLYLTQEFAEGLGLDGLRNNLNMNGYKVVNVGNPSNIGDAANKWYVDNLQRFAIRTPEQVPVLPPATTRANKVMGFDASGNPIATLPATGSGTELAIDLANAVDPNKGAGMVGYLQAGVGAVGRPSLSKLRERVTVQDFGAVEGDVTNNVSLALIEALAAHDVVHIPKGSWYGGPASAADEHLVVKMSAGKHVVFEEGAKFYFGQSGDTYLPAFAGISSSKWSLINPHFVWTGQIRWSVSGDLQYAVPDPISPVVTRLGAPHAYQAYIFNAAVVILSSHSVYIENFKIESLDPSRPCLQGISSARTTGGAIIVNGCDLNDTNVGILAQGGDILRVTRLRQGRSNQDIGIPGHALYSFVTHTFVDDVIDTGEETGALRTSGFTVSYKGEGTFQMSNVNSRRAFGPVGWATANGKAEKITIDNLVWTDTDTVVLEESNVPVIYNAGSPDGDDSMVTFNNVVLSTKRDRALLGGSMHNVTGRLTLRRQDAVATSKSYLFGRFVGCDLDVKLIQRGAFDAAVYRMQPGGATLLSNNTWRVALDGFNNPPVFDYAESDGRWAANRIIFTLPKVRADGNANTNRSLGNPDICMPGTTNFTKGQNFVGVTEDTSMWHREYAAGVASISGNFPLPIGSYLVEVMVVASTGTWRRLYRYLVSVARPDGVGAFMNTVQQLGTVSAIGAGFLAADPVVTVPENLTINVAATVTNATALTLPTAIYLSYSRLGS